VASVSIPASVTLQDSNNKDKTITFSGQNQKRSYSDKTAYLPADSGTSGFEMLNPSGTASGRLKGEVTVTVEFTKASRLEMKSYPVPVVIEERRGLITDTDYIQGEITAYDSGKITAKIMKNGKPTGLTSGNIALGIFYQDGTRENLKTTFTEGGGGTYTITPSSAIGKNVQKIEVYVYSRVDPKKTGNNVNTNVWYVVDSKTISELSSL
ncbi:MAG: hypothetical protein Q4Q04_01420, partial [Methanocorpusculum sp.]|nr:hypothetical protein [Methanocorpusculum sp.]